MLALVSCIKKLKHCAMFNMRKDCLACKSLLAGNSLKCLSRSNQEIPQRHKQPWTYINFERCKEHLILSTTHFFSSPPQPLLNISTCLLSNLGKTSRHALTQHFEDCRSHRRRSPFASSACFLSMDWRGTRAGGFHRLWALALAFGWERISARKNLSKSALWCDFVFGFRAARRALRKMWKL